MVAKETSFRPRRKPPRPLNREKLEELALAYVARFATSSAKFQAYLHRKLRERGFEGGDLPDIAALAERYCELGYIDDAAYARSKGEGLRARGYGPRRIDQSLRVAGIEEELRDAATGSEAQARMAAARLARRRRFGPFGERVDLQAREKQIAAMVRAGHSFDAARAIVDAPDDRAVDDWVAEAEGME